MNLCRALRSESGRKFRVLGALLRPVGLDAPLHAHMMPAEPPEADIATDAHRAWASIWSPEQVRHDSFDDLFAAAVRRSQALIGAAGDYMTGRASYASLRALHGGFSYDSGLPWQTTCAAKNAPGVTRK